MGFTSLSGRKKFKKHFSALKCTMRGKPPVDFVRFGAVSLSIRHEPATMLVQDPTRPGATASPYPRLRRPTSPFMWMRARRASAGSAPPASRRPKRRERPLPRILCALVRVCRLLLRQRADDFRHPHSIQAAIILLFRQVEVFPFVARSVFQHACSPLRRCAVAWSASVPRNRSPPVCC